MEREKEKSKYDPIMSKINDLDSRDETNGLNSEKRDKRGALKLQLASFLKAEEITWRQKFRERWLSGGDCNAKYFNVLAPHMRGCNFIDEIWCDDKVTGDVELREAARCHFSKLYEDEACHWPNLDGLQFKNVSEGSNLLLEAIFSEDEVTDCLKSCNDNKAPGPDGFNMKFLTTF